MWKLYLYSKAAESIFEAAPFAVFQCGYLIWLEDYEPWLLFSTILSFVNTGIPVADFLKLRCFENSISNINLTEKLIIIIFWSLDIIVRTLPWLYMYAHINGYGVDEDFLFEEYGLQENHYEFGELSYWNGVGFILNIISVIYFFIGVRRTCIGKTLAIITSSWTLVLFSYPKFRTVGSKWWLETFTRFSFSIVVMFDVWKRHLIRFWQLALFSLMTIVTGICQIYVCWHIDSADSAIYTGFRISSSPTGSKEKEIRSPSDRSSAHTGTFELTILEGAASVGLI